MQTKLWKSLRTVLIPFGTALFVTPCFWACALTSAGTGHGTYIPGAIFFPYASLFMVILWRVEPLLSAKRFHGMLLEPMLYRLITPIALVTYFLYAVIFALVHRSHYKYYFLGALIFIHLAVMVLALVIGGKQVIWCC